MQLGTAADVDGGFRLGQDTLSSQGIRDTGTLAMNSMSTRSEDQIHIHVCDWPGSPLRDVIDGLDVNKYRTSQPVDLSGLHKSNSKMNCRVSPNTGVDVNVARDVLDWLKQYQGSSDCAQYNVGAGVITDSNDYSWACIVTGSRAAENLFCP